MRALLGPDGHWGRAGGKCPSEGLGKGSDAPSWAGSVSAAFARTRPESEWVGGVQGAGMVEESLLGSRVPGGPLRGPGAALAPSPAWQ